MKETVLKQKILKVLLIIEFIVFSTQVGLEPEKQEQIVIEKDYFFFALKKKIRLWYIHLMGYSAIKRNELLIHATT